MIKEAPQIPGGGESLNISQRDANASTDSIPQTQAERNGKFNEEAENVSGGAPYSVGAAPSGFDPYSHMQNEYGTIEPGENPARMVDVPRSTDGEDRVRRWARTVMEAEVTPDVRSQAPSGWTGC